MEVQALGLTVAFAAGLLSFLSPCVLPLVPSYATFITGMSLEDLARGSTRARRTVMVHGALFVLGFSLVFIAFGASASLIGSMFAFYRGWIERIGGILLIVFGLYLLGVLRLPGAQREFRLQLSNKPVGYAGTALVGIAFGAGWTPCIGPVLGGILTLAGTTGSVGQGMGLLSAYSLGLALPFMLATVALDQFLIRFKRFRHLLPWVSRASGALLILVGTLLLTGAFTTLSAMLIRFTPTFLIERL